MFIIYGNNYIFSELFFIFECILSIFTEQSTFMETHFSQNAKKLLKDKGLTQSEFCERLGYKKSNWENIVKTNNIDMLSEIAEVLEMSLEDVIGLNKQKFSIYGFIKLNDTIYEISSKDNIKDVLKEIEDLEGMRDSK